MCKPDHLELKRTNPNVNLTALDRNLFKLKEIKKYSNDQLLFKNNKIIIYIVFTLILLIGLIVYKDYGLTIDDEKT